MSRVAASVRTTGEKPSGQGGFALPPFPPQSINGGRFAGAEEPLLSDLLSDPMTHRVMESDGVEQVHLMLVIAEVQARLNGA
ncbi:MAG: hypothetical protein HQL33_03345 [Alphaproteobacteria bacterium]|nr:hypothetical protein [Alphaproteobacteria bacterium]MBF0129007.1 hypothetical protein [Alphaproteobacteria bacterium]